MRISLLTFLFFFNLLLISCETKRVSDKDGSSFKSGKDSVSILLIEKGTSHLANYKVEKSKTGRVVAFDYNNLRDTFSLFYDSLKENYMGSFGTRDTVHFYTDTTIYYSINSNNYKVVKLTGDKDLTDGSFSVFFSSEFGFLLSRSDTWRSAKVLQPNNESQDYLQIATLLFKIQEDNGIMLNRIPPPVRKEIQHLSIE
ncbi:MAG: hypothetical protein KF862_24665 [Chitinophagaceae bacterium]|nr:hypothetical protein [Chitinophagaceae bacterium]